MAIVRVRHRGPCFFIHWDWLLAGTFQWQQGASRQGWQETELDEGSVISRTEESLLFFMDKFYMTEVTPPDSSSERGDKEAYCFSSSFPPVCISLIAPLMISFTDDPNLTVLPAFCFEMSLRLSSYKLLSFSLVFVLVVLKATGCTLVVKSVPVSELHWHKLMFSLCCNNTNRPPGNVSLQVALTQCHNCSTSYSISCSKCNTLFLTCNSTLDFISSSDVLHKVL